MLSGFQSGDYHTGVVCRHDDGWGIRPGDDVEVDVVGVASGRGPGEEDGGGVDRLDFKIKRRGRSSCSIYEGGRVGGEGRGGEGRGGEGRGGGRGGLKGGIVTFYGGVCEW